MKSKIKAGDYVMVKFEHGTNSPVSAHKTHKVLEIYADNTMLLQGYPEPLKVEMFAKMVIGKVKAY